MAETENVQSRPSIRPLIAEAKLTQLVRSVPTNFIGNIPGKVDDDLVFTFEWPPNSSYSRVSAISVLPNIDVVHINVYFLEVQNETMLPAKYTTVHDKGYYLMINRYLIALLTSVQNNLIFYKGRIHSESTNAINYFTSIAFEPNGKIVRAICDCPAGNKPKAVCEHMACICYAILRYKDHFEWPIEKAPGQQWEDSKNMKLIFPPTNDEILTEAFQRDEIEIQRYNVIKRKCDRMCYDPRPAKICNSTQWNLSVREHITKYCCLEENPLSINSMFKGTTVDKILSLGYKDDSTDDDDDQI